MGSLCALFTVVSQNVMAAVCFHALFSNTAFKYASVALGRLPRLPSCVGQIVWVTFCGSLYVCHIMRVIMCVSCVMCIICAKYDIWVTLNGHLCNLCQVL